MRYAANIVVSSVITSILLLWLASLVAGVPVIALVAGTHFLKITVVIVYWLPVCVLILRRWYEQSH